MGEASPRVSSRASSGYDGVAACTSTLSMYRCAPACAWSLPADRRTPRPTPEVSRAPDPARKGQAPGRHGRPGRPQPARPRRQAELSRSDCAHHRCRGGGRAGWPLGLRIDAGGRPCPHRRPGDGGHRRDDPRHPSGGDLSRRHQARHRPPPDPRRALVGRAGHCDDASGRDRLQRRRTAHPAHRGQCRRSADPGRPRITISTR